MINNQSLSPLISIIVPIYKVEKYLNICIESIISQTYNNIELILVDDGSPDNCGSICDEYEKKYPFIKVLHQKNQGQAAARNNGVKISRGGFISFVDSDDFIAPDAMEYLLSLQKKYNSDITIGGMRYVYEGTSMSQQSNKTIQECILDKQEALKRMNYLKGFGATPWAKLYRRDLIEKHPFPEGKLYEDLATLYKIIADGNIIVFSNKVVYYWIQREGSTMRSLFNEKQLYAFEAIRQQIGFMEKAYPEVVQSAKVRYMAKIVELMPLALKSSNSKESYKVLKKEMLYTNQILKDRQMKLSQKIRLLSIKCGFYTTKLVFSLHEKVKKISYF